MHRRHCSERPMRTSSSRSSTRVPSSAPAITTRQGRSGPRGTMEAIETRVRRSGKSVSDPMEAPPRWPSRGPRSIATRRPQRVRPILASRAGKGHTSVPPMPELDLTGTHTALATPFSASGAEVDFASYEKLLDQQLAGRITGLVPCGTTGEAPTLSPAEQRELVVKTVRAARGKAKVVVGTGTNDTKKTIELTRAAFEAGADAAMLAMPYYSK